MGREDKSRVRSVEFSIPKKCAFLREPYRYKVLHGGRGGAKSHSIAKVLLVTGMERKHRVLCTRELQTSIRDSVHRVLSDQIEILGLQDFYRTTQTQIYGNNGTEFVFSGLKHNIESIQSMEGITLCWVEEAQRVSEYSWSKLIPTVRAEGSEFYVSFNPDLMTDPTYKRFITNPPPKSKVAEINWQDNPFFPATLAAEKDYDYRVDPDVAAHVWGGKTRTYSKAAILFGKYVIDSFSPQEGWGGPYFGADWGFANDPTALVRCWVDGRTLYIDDEVYGISVETEDLPALFDRIPEAKAHVIRADNARPEIVSHMRNHGYPRMEACDKWPGSIEDGISHLRGYERIVIHPRCQRTAEEVGLWSFKTDKLTGDILPEIIDRHNHLMDSLRYALGPFIRGAANLAGPSEDSLW